MTEIYTKLFNLILLSGKTPDEWSIGMIKPIYKQKGSCDDPNNYRGITVLSCFGKLFTSVINNRLLEYFDENSTTGPEQAGFRSCWKSVFVAKTFRLWCWRLYTDRYKGYTPKAKSCVKKGSTYSDYFLLLIKGFAMGKMCHLYFAPSI